MEKDTIGSETEAAVEELLEAAGLKPGQLLVVGCSTSEVQGEKIGSSGSVEVAGQILGALLAAARKHKIYLAVQCCEHLNRALVIEEEAREKYGLEEVAVVPMPHAGGSLGACAWRKFRHPTMVEEVEANAGIDIGQTLIGMHLKRVAVPVRLTQKHIGRAVIAAARTRPRFIGGKRAVYDLPQ